MIINERIFVCVTLFIIGIECLHNYRTYQQPSYQSQIGLPYGLDQSQGDMQVRSMNMNRFSTIARIQQLQPRIQQMQERPQTPWIYQRGIDMWKYPIPEQTTPTTTTQRYLPHSPVRLRSRTTTPNSTEHSTSTYKPYRKFGQGQEVTTSKFIDHTVIYSGKERALAHISTNLQTYFLRAVIRDFSARLSASVHAHKVLLSHNELAVLENQCTLCTTADMQGLLTILLTIMEKYPALISDPSLFDHVAVEYERAKEYLNRKLKLLRKETANIQVDDDFRNIEKRYTRRERNGGVMNLLLDWFESYARSGRIDEENLKMKLMKYLTTQKRYWLISIRGVL